MCSAQARCCTLWMTISEGGGWNDDFKKLMAAEQNVEEAEAALARHMAQRR